MTRLRGAERSGHVSRFPAVHRGQVGAGVPRGAGFADDGVPGLAGTELAAGRAQKITDARRFAEREGFDFAERIIQPELIAHAALEDACAHGERAFGRDGTRQHALSIRGEGFARGGEARGIGGQGTGAFQEFGDGVEQCARARGGLLHDLAPHAFRAVNERRGFIEVTRRLAQERTEMAGDAPGLVLAALEFVEHDVEDGVERGGIHRVPAAVEVLAFAEQLAAKREAVEVLVAGEFARRDGIEERERTPAQLLLAGLELEVGVSKLAAGGLDSREGRVGRVVREHGFEVAVQQSLELA